MYCQFSAILRANLLSHGSLEVQVLQNEEWVPQGIANGKLRRAFAFRNMGLILSKSAVTKIGVLQCCLVSS